MRGIFFVLNRVYLIFFSSIVQYVNPHYSYKNAVNYTDYTFNIVQQIILFSNIIGIIFSQYSRRYLILSD